MTTLPKVLRFLLSNGLPQDRYTASAVIHGYLEDLLLQQDQLWCTVCPEKPVQHPLFQTYEDLDLAIKDCLISGILIVGPNFSGLKPYPGVSLKTTNQDLQRLLEAFQKITSTSH